MSETASVTVPVFTFLVNESEQVYLQRRYQTDYLDGYYEPPAGKVDKKEFPKQAAIREVREEAGVIVAHEDLELFHSYANITNGVTWMGLFYRTRSWEGIPTIKEPNKCDDAGFYDLDNLPRLTPQVSDAISRLLIAPTIEMSTYTHIPSS